MSERQIVTIEDLGKCSFSEAWEYQTLKMDELKAIKKARKTYEERPAIAHSLLICEHQPVFTLGKSGSIDHLLLNETELEDSTYEFFKINRGGDITFHGPGQLTVYPILDLDYFFHDVHKYVRTLEEIVIKTLEEFNVKGVREKDFTGVWIEGSPMRKICAIGVHMSRWITMHGFALNVNTDLGHFDKIVPCGIADENRAVTSLKKELGQELNIEAVKEIIKQKFSEVFEVDAVAAQF